MKSIYNNIYLKEARDAVDVTQKRMVFFRREPSFGCKCLTILNPILFLLSKVNKRMSWGKNKKKNLTIGRLLDNRRDNSYHST